MELVTDAAGNPVEKCEYDAWGKPRFWTWAGDGWSETAESGIGNRFLFTGREWDAEVGLYEFRARTYDSGVGRFLQIDLIAPAIDHYQYAANAPFSATDPLGLAPGDIWDPRSYDWGVFASDVGQKVAAPFVAAGEFYSQSWKSGLALGSHPGTVGDAVVGNYQAAREGGASVSTSLAVAGGTIVGTTPLAESIAGYGYRERRNLSGMERLERGAAGLGGTILSGTGLGNLALRGAQRFAAPRCSTRPPTAPARGMGPRGARNELPLSPAQKAAILRDAEALGINPADIEFWSGIQGTVFSDLMDKIVVGPNVLPKGGVPILGTRSVMDRLRAYPKKPALRSVIKAQAAWSIAM